MNHDSATALMPMPRQASVAGGLSVVIVSPGGTRPAFAGSIGGRVTADLADVRVTDDVVVLAGRGGGRYFAQLVARFGADTPPVLVIAPGLDPIDVRTALDHGITGYLLESECPPKLDWTIRDTAARMSWLGPGAASMLISRVRTTRRGPLPTGWADLTPREEQILALVADGHAPAEVAAKLRLRAKTVRNNLSNVYAKLHVRGMTEAIIVWLNRS